MGGHVVGHGGRHGGRQGDRQGDRHGIDMVAKKIDIDVNINMEIHFGERVGHGSWLIGPKLFRPEALPDLCVFSAL